MSGEPGRQIRVTIPVPVFEQINRTAAALGISVNELGARCVVEGVGPAIVGRISELEQALAALRIEIEPAPPVPAKAPAPVVPEEESTASSLPDRKPGRAERAAAERSEAEPSADQPVEKRPAGFLTYNHALDRFERAEESANVTEAPSPKQGRAEKAAAVRSAELAEERRRGNRRTRSNGKEATA